MPDARGDDAGAPPSVPRPTAMPLPVGDGSTAAPYAAASCCTTPALVIGRDAMIPMLGSGRMGRGWYIAPHVITMHGEPLAGATQSSFPHRPCSSH